MRVVIWGTYDTGKPRTRILIAGLRAADAEVIECHNAFWHGVEDKSQLTPLRNFVRLLYCIFVVYPVMVIRYLALPRHDAVLIGYMGTIDVLVLWPFARLRRVPIIWDAFLSVYNTTVEDRKMVAAGHPVAYLLKFLERLDCRAADMTILDTAAHGQYFVDVLGLDPARLGVIPVGAETDIFAAAGQSAATGVISKKSAADTIQVLFYGQFIPLHGIATIISAARLAEDRGDPIFWTVIGQGQDEPHIEAMLHDRPLYALTWQPWVEYAELPEAIAKADVCLGIFGDTEKAARVIPNKVFQAAAVGTPIVTRDSPAIRELFSPDTLGVRLVPPDDPQALLDAILDIGRAVIQRPLFADLRDALSPAGVGRRLYDLIDGTVKQHAGRKPAHNNNTADRS